MEPDINKVKDYHAMLMVLDFQLDDVHDLVTRVKEKQRADNGLVGNARWRDLEARVIRLSDHIRGMITAEAGDTGEDRAAAGAAVPEQIEGIEEQTAASEVVNNGNEASLPEDGQEEAGPAHDVQEPSEEAEGKEPIKDELNDESAPAKQPEAADDAGEPEPRDTQELGIAAQNAVNDDEDLLEPAPWAVDRRPRLFFDVTQTDFSMAAASSARQHDHRKCVVCCTDHPRKSVVKSHCSHYFCHSCLTDFVESAIRNEALFPPFCCGKPVPIDANSSLFTHQVLKDFVAKKLEYGTKERTYCHQRTCSAFIPPNAIADTVGTCVECKHQTCVACKAVAHPGNCRKDTATQELLDIAHDEGWQQCPSCKRMVELQSGCFRITCACRTQFCYLCAKPWKTCSCPQWDESRVIP